MKTTAITGRAQTPAHEGKTRTCFGDLTHDLSLAAEGIERGLSDAEIAAVTDLPEDFVGEVRRIYRPIAAREECGEA